MLFDLSRIVLADLAADNELRVVADCAYMHTGEGLHRFTDPADSETYLYSQFEVPDARRVFAVFEQPDLKASFAFTVSVPEGWTVLSCSPTPEPRAVGGASVFAFAPTEPISSYTLYLPRNGQQTHGADLSVLCRSTVYRSDYCNRTRQGGVRASERLPQM